MDMHLSLGWHSLCVRGLIPVELAFYPRAIVQAADVKEGVRMNRGPRVGQRSLLLEYHERHVEMKFRQLLRVLAIRS